MSTAKVSLAEVFHPWVRWEKPGSGLSVRPPASGNLGFLKTYAVVGIRKMAPGHICVFSKPKYSREFATWDPDIFSKSEIFKISLSVHSE